MNKKYLELTKLIRSKQNDHEILKCLSNYHENDIADMLTVMTPKERKRKIYTHGKNHGLFGNSISG